MTCARDAARHLIARFYLDEGFDTEGCIAAMSEDYQLCDRARLATALDAEHDRAKLEEVVEHLLQQLPAVPAPPTDHLSVQSLGKVYELRGPFASTTGVLHALAQQFGVYGKLFDGQGELFADDPIAANPLRFEPQELAVDFASGISAVDIRDGLYPLAPAVSHVSLTKLFFLPDHRDTCAAALSALCRLTSLRIPLVPPVPLLYEVLEAVPKLQWLHCEIHVGRDAEWSDLVHRLRPLAPLRSVVLHLGSIDLLDKVIVELPDSLEKLTLIGNVAGTGALSHLHGLKEFSWHCRRTVPQHAAKVVHRLTADVPGLEALRLSSCPSEVVEALQPLCCLRELSISGHGDFRALAGVLASSPMIVKLAQVLQRVLRQAGTSPRCLWAPIFAACRPGFPVRE
mmetsp:Transcript_78020/g.208558  ORF Transcript_78020/g.208558 Transcript_78020/m.208558 type:complete len:399 (-) Transcript_78020:567-1763(-)